MVLYHAVSTYLILRDFRLPPPSKSDLCYSGILRSVWWNFLTDVSAQPIDPMLILEDGTDILSRNVGWELLIYKSLKLSRRYNSIKCSLADSRVKM